jgi:hypothetical protein
MNSRPDVVEETMISWMGIIITFNYFNWIS